MGYQKLNGVVKDIWVDALRSERFNQGEKYLSDSDIWTASGETRFCCWGVLSELTVEAGECIANPDSQARHTLYGEDQNRYYPPSEVLVWAGLEGNANANDEMVSAPGGVSGIVATLAKMNDSGRSFLEIAQKIEEDY